jgi:hypothetical protein
MRRSEVACEKTEIVGGALRLRYIFWGGIGCLCLSVASTSG